MPWVYSLMEVPVRTVLSGLRVRERKHRRMHTSTLLHRSDFDFANSLMACDEVQALREVALVYSLMERL